MVSLTVPIIFTVLNSIFFMNLQLKAHYTGLEKKNMEVSTFKGKYFFVCGI